MIGIKTPYRQIIRALEVSWANATRMALVHLYSKVGLKRIYTDTADHLLYRAYKCI